MSKRLVLCGHERDQRLGVWCDQRGYVPPRPGLAADLLDLAERAIVLLERSLRRQTADDVRVWEIETRDFLSEVYVDEKPGLVEQMGSELRIQHRLEILARAIEALRVGEER